MNAKTKMIFILTALFLSLGLFGVAFGGGAEGGAGSDCDCVLNADPKPEAQKGPFVKGTFTVSRDPFTINTEFDHYTVHLFLRKGGDTKLYSFTTGAPGPKNLCNYTAEDLLDLYAALPCQLDVDKDFGFEGELENTFTPLFKSLIITDKSNCDNIDNEDDLIRGEVIIGFVPFITCE
jgi:hypothetical protein